VAAAAALVAVPSCDIFVCHCSTTRCSTPSSVKTPTRETKHECCCQSAPGAPAADQLRCARHQWTVAAALGSIAPPSPPPQRVERVGRVGLVRAAWPVHARTCTRTCTCTRHCHCQCHCGAASECCCARRQIGRVGQRVVERLRPAQDAQPRATPQRDQCACRRRARRRSFASHKRWLYRCLHGDVGGLCCFRGCCNYRCCWYQ
jgi:hypothetical protein